LDAAAARMFLRRALAGEEAVADIDPRRRKDLGAPVEQRADLARRTVADEAMTLGTYGHLRVSSSRMAPPSFLPYAGDRDPAARRTPACGTSRSRASTRTSCSPPPGASPAAVAPAAPPRRSLALDPAWSLPQSPGCRPCPPADQPEPSLRHGRRAPGTRGTPPADATAGQPAPPAPRNQPQPNTPGQQITDAKDRD
jgi:hypothetical protein